MERTPVTSSNIRAIGYDSDSQVLQVEFNDGAVYDYAAVPESDYDGLMGADSKGKYFNANIKNRYSHMKL